MTSVGWHDLLAARFLLGGEDPATGLDCWGVARIIRERLRQAHLPALPTREGDCSPVALEGLKRIAERPSLGTPVGALIFGDPEGRGYPSHVSIVVEPGRALTATVRHGVLSLPVRSAACQFGVYE
jgi:cell wall-associated NlpC family hydrolase